MTAPWWGRRIAAGAPDDGPACVPGWDSALRFSDREIAGRRIPRFWSRLWGGIQRGDVTPAILPAERKLDIEFPPLASSDLAWIIHELVRDPVGRHPLVNGRRAGWRQVVIARPW